MNYFENEILKELVVGNSYSEKQIRIFMQENPKTLILSDTEISHMENFLDRMHKVKSKEVKYSYKSSKFEIPQEKQTIYILE